MTAPLKLISHKLCPYVQRAVIALTEKGAPFERIDIDLEQAFRGTSSTLELRRPDLRPDGTLEVKTHTVRVTIPPGVSEGQLIRLAGQGEPATGEGRAGDLYLEVHIRPHGLYLLEGRDITLTLPLAPWEAALGAAVTVPTLGGPVLLGRRGD